MSKLYERSETLKETLCISCYIMITVKYYLLCIFKEKLFELDFFWKHII